MLQLGLAFLTSATTITTTWIVYRVRKVHELVNSQHELLVDANARLERQLRASEVARGIESAAAGDSRPFDEPPRSGAV